MTGLARKAVEVIKKPLNATIIEEIKLPPPPPPPPPPKKRIIEPPKARPPEPPPYVPPPDIPAPTPPAPVIAQVAPTPPVEPPVIAPPPPPVVQAPPAPKPAVRRGISPVSRVEPTYPREAIRQNIPKGRVVARLQIDEKGNVTDVRIMESDPPRVFDREVVRALSQWKFAAEGERYVGEVEVNFTLKDE
jgi:protein TonB